MNAVPCLSWIKRGAAKRLPDRVKLGAEELDELVKNFGDADIESDSDSSEEAEDAEEVPTSTPTEGKRKRKLDSGDDSQKAAASAAIIKSQASEIEDRYDLDDYDDESDEEAGAMGMKSISYYSTNKDDPYLAKGDGEDTDEEEIQITKEDNLIACGKMTGDYFNLEVYVYNENDSNVYCHHDTILATFPLCMEWLDFDPGEEQPGNLLAIGSMEPDIEIWDLDVMGSLEPAYVLAGAEKQKSKGKKKKKAEMNGHTDAVLGLSWNKLQRNVLASASADFTVGLWDLQNGKMVTSLQHHKEKVQTISWHPFESQTLLSGSFDHTAKVYDCRSPDKAVKSWTLPGEVERVLWNNHDPYCFLASSETGHLYYMDARTEKPLFILSAHTGAVSGLSMSPTVPGCLVTCSDDKEVKVWDIRGNKPSLVHTRSPKIGVIHCCSFCPDSGLIFAVGGERELKVINLNKNQSVVSQFELTVKDSSGDGDASEIVGPGNDDRDSETEEMFGADEAGEDSPPGDVKENASPSTSDTSVVDTDKKKRKKKKNKAS